MELVVVATVLSLLGKVVSLGFNVTPPIIPVFRAVNPDESRFNRGGVSRTTYHVSRAACEVRCATWRGHCPRLPLPREADFALECGISMPLFPSAPHIHKGAGTATDRTRHRCTAICLPIPGAGTSGTPLLQRAKRESNTPSPANLPKVVPAGWHPPPADWRRARPAPR